MPGTGDGDGLIDVYRSQGGVITLLTGSNPAGSGGFTATFRGISADGDALFFQTEENVPGTGDTDSLLDVYRAQGGVITLLSGSNPTGSGGATASFRAASSDGTRVLFQTSENIPGSNDSDGLGDTHLAQSGTIALVSGNNPAGTGGATSVFLEASSNATIFFFRTTENIPGTSDTDLLEDVYRAKEGLLVPMSGNNPVGTGGAGANYEGASDDGSRVFFHTTENIPGTGDSDGLDDVYQGTSAARTLLSGNNPGGTGGEDAGFEQASADGTRVFFETDENVPNTGDTDGATDAYQAQGGVITLLSGNTPGGSGSFFESASSDGTRVVFETDESIPGAGDTDLLQDVYQAQAGDITLLTRSNPAGTGGSSAFSPGSSSDGTRVFFGTDENIVGSGDTDGFQDIYQAHGGVISLLTGSNLAAGGNTVNFRGSTVDGTLVFFETSENIPGTGDTDGGQDVYQSRVVPPPPGAGPPALQPTGRRAAALKKCKTKPRRARAKCRKKAKRLPV